MVVEAAWDVGAGWERGSGWVPSSAWSTALYLTAMVGAACDMEPALGDLVAVAAAWTGGGLLLQVQFELCSSCAHSSVSLVSSCRLPRFEDPLADVCFGVCGF
jgi:hypothetical protein